MDLKKISNKGLSLIEVLVGVTMLGIIIVPVLNSLVSASKTLEKSRITGEATTIATSISEKLELSDFDDIISNQVFLNSNTTLEEETYIIDIESITSGGSDYKAKVILNPNNSDTDDINFEEINALEVLEYTSMDGVFAQNRIIYDDYDDINNIPLSGISDPDFLSYKNFPIESTWYKPPTGDKDIYAETGYDTFIKKNRTMRIIIEETSPNIISAKVVYDYEFVLGTEKHYDSIEFELIKDFEVKNGVYPNLFVIYHPYYIKIPKNELYDEKIEIYNEDNLPVNLYLIKQNDPNTQIIPEVTHGTSIELIQTESNTGFKLLSNVTYNYTTGELDLDNFVEYKSSDSEIKWSDENEKLFGKEQVNRIYDAVIEIYDLNDEHLFTLDTVKLS